MTSDVSSVVEIVLRIARDVRSARTYKRKPISPFENIHSSRTNQTNPIHSTRSNIRSNNQIKFLCSYKYRARTTPKLVSSASQWYTGIKKYDEKPF
jgi:hypothetical protein